MADGGGKGGAPFNPMPSPNASPVHPLAPSPRTHTPCRPPPCSSPPRHPAPPGHRAAGPGQDLQQLGVRHDDDLRRKRRDRAGGRVHVQGLGGGSPPALGAAPGRGHHDARQRTNVGSPPPIPPRPQGLGLTWQDLGCNLGCRSGVASSYNCSAAARFARRRARNQPISLLAWLECSGARAGALVQCRTANAAHRPHPAGANFLLKFVFADFLMRCRQIPVFFRLG